MEVQVEKVDAFRRQVDAVDSVQTRVGAAPDVIMCQRGAAQVRDDVLNPAVHRRSDQIYLLTVAGVTPHPPGEDVGPHQEALRENASHGGQILPDGGQQVGGAVGAQIVTAQMQDENVRVGPGDFQLVELRQQLRPRHALSALPPDSHFAGVHAQLHTYLWRLGPRLRPVHQRVATDPDILGPAAQWLA